MNYLDKIIQIRNTKGLNFKMYRLRALANDDIFKKILLYTYNPFFLYHIAIIPPYEKSQDNTFTLDDMFTLLDNLKSRKITGNTAKDYVSNSMSMMDDGLCELFKLILTRDLKMGINVTSINKIIPNLIPSFNVMLADSGKTAREMCRESSWLYIQKKSDGKRCITIVKDDLIEFFARSGKEIETLNDHTPLIDNLSELRKTVFKYDFVLDGELVIINKDGSDADRQYSNSLINKKSLTKDEIEQFTYIVWDILPLNEFEHDSNKTQYEQRFNTLTSGINNESKALKTIETHIIKEASEAIKITNNYISSGFEGSIIKTPHHFYERKRSKHWMKYKSILDCDLEVIGFNYGKAGTKYESMLGSLDCQTSDGLLKVSVGSGFTDVQRRKITDDIIGDIIEVQFNKVSKDVNGDYSLFLPVFKSIRTDEKQEANTLEDVLSLEHN